ncbi:hypothetical protein [Streptomyces nigrescens]|uniref:hypothetical protein n=1 Tax=Streptomyces nigrescens TaxID=1920 RepID=UPI0036FA41B9
MNTPEPHATPPASAAALRTALDGVRHATETAWVVALAVLADAASGQIRQYCGLIGAAHSTVTSSLGTARIVPESIGDAVELDLHVGPAAYERIRAHLLEECIHDEECQCESDPWPALRDLPREAEVEILNIKGEVRGTATRSPFGIGKVALFLDDEDVFKAAEALRIAASLVGQPAPGEPAPSTPK